MDMSLQEAVEWAFDNARDILHTNYPAYVGDDNILRWRSTNEAVPIRREYFHGWEKVEPEPFVCKECGKTWASPGTILLATGICTLCRCKPKPQVEECMDCNGPADPLHSWQCANGTIEALCLSCASKRSDGLAKLLAGPDPLCEKCGGSLGPFPKYWQPRWCEECRRKATTPEEWTDAEFARFYSLTDAVFEEGKRQVRKWGIQTRTPFEWMCYLTEEVGELAKAISEYAYREGTTERIRKEAIQVATLALKIAEMATAARMLREDT